MVPLLPGQGSPAPLGAANQITGASAGLDKPLLKRAQLMYKRGKSSAWKASLNGLGNADVCVFTAWLAGSAQVWGAAGLCQRRGWRLFGLLARRLEVGQRLCLDLARFWMEEEKVQLLKRRLSVGLGLQSQQTIPDCK